MVLYSCLQSEGGDLEAAAAAAAGGNAEATPEGKGTISKSLDPQMLEKVCVLCFHEILVCAQGVP